MADGCFFDRSSRNKNYVSLEHERMDFSSNCSNKFSVLTQCFDIPYPLSLQPKLSILTRRWKDIRAVALRWKDDNNTSFQSRRYLHLTTSTALDLLRLPKTDFHHGHGGSGGGTGPPISYKQLRDAFFQSAKRCHPDVHNKGGTNNSNNTDTTTPREAAQMFLDVTEAYEFLLASTTNATSAAEQEEEGGGAFTIPKEEEMEYREAFELWLGIPAEVVEETKKCPLF